MYLLHSICCNKVAVCRENSVYVSSALLVYYEERKEEKINRSFACRFCVSWYARVFPFKFTWFIWSQKWKKTTVETAPEKHQKEQQGQQQQQFYYHSYTRAVVVVIVAVIYVVVFINRNLKSSAIQTIHVIVFVIRLFSEKWQTRIHGYTCTYNIYVSLDLPWRLCYR